MASSTPVAAERASGLQDAEPIADEVATTSGREDDRATSRALAARWMATLDDRPFRPTPERLAWVAGSDLVQGEARARRLPLAAARYAGLFADHVAQDMAVEGGPGAYVRIWLCARRAFIDNMSAGIRAGRSDAGVASWDYEGGAALASRPSPPASSVTPADGAIARSLTASAATSRTILRYPFAARRISCPGLPWRRS